MSELKYGTVVLSRTDLSIDFKNLADTLGWKYINNCRVNMVNKQYGNSGSALIIPGYKNNFPTICSIGSYIGIANHTEGDNYYYSVHFTGTGESGSLSLRTIYARYAINEETNDWVISITDKTNYDNNNKGAVYATFIGTSFEDGRRVIFAPDGTMLYMNDDGTWEESDYKALYNNIGANYSSVITRYTMLVDFCAIDIKTGELIPIPRFRYATLYNGGYEVEKFEEIGVGDVYALVPGATKNNIAVCLKEVTWYDVD